MRLQACGFYRLDINGFPITKSGERSQFKSDTLWENGVACVDYFNGEVLWLLDRHGNRVAVGKVGQVSLVCDRPGSMLYTED